MEESLMVNLSAEVLEDVKQYSPLTLAFIGDGVYELFVRTQIVKNTNAPTGQLHKRCVRFVCAEGQCAAYDFVAHMLSEEEIGIFKRGRNTKVNTKAKNATLAAYKKATGFEALLGYLYVTGQIDRLNAIMHTSFSKMCEQTKEV